jgi:hypothetical protein
MNKRVRLLPNTYQKLTDNMGFPGQLRGICDVLPLAPTIREQGILWLNALRRGAQDFQQIRARVSSTLLDNLNSHSFARNTTWHKEDTALVSAYGIPSIGKIC